MVKIVHIRVRYLFEWFTTIFLVYLIHSSDEMTMYNVLVNKQINIKIVSVTSLNDTTTIPPSLIKMMNRLNNCDLFEKYKIPIPSDSTTATSSRNMTLCLMQTRVTNYRTIKRGGGGGEKENKQQLEDENDEIDEISDQKKRMKVNLEKTKDYNDIMINHIMMVSKYTYHALQHRIFPGTYFAFLMSHSLKNKKKDTNIGFSKNPIHSLYLHNGQHIVNKNTSSAAPHWILDIILGPFSTERQAMDCCNEWVSKTRGRESKRLKAYTLYKKYGVNLYSHQVKLNEPYDQFLFNINAPLNYIKKTRELLHK